MSVDYFEKIFQKHDDNNSGTLSKVEFQECFKELGLNWTGEMEEIYKEFDEDNSGEVAYDGEILPYLVQSVSNFGSLLNHTRNQSQCFLSLRLLEFERKWRKD